MARRLPRCLAIVIAEPNMRYPVSTKHVYGKYPKTKQAAPRSDVFMLIDVKIYGIIITITKFVLIFGQFVLENYVL